ncbi:hypothetical protein C731_2299 [Mycolicibacterium hassiacum DSM 44199]|uniref:Uncharacterized protein n=2 Tax=Mycolicibacterium hassiacum TaxID=46351 RepID=K5BBB0_MYCHD|nr:hypothetical protein C731_2299 [Mycolicibacterium hassiacum DSM 44199]MBX5486601.1 HXXEE domain-containing protein [Mycolicibacterium hassiacum]PZN25209.1 MAG: HXXEE domain-containing protein [Mycolicibacterium hassiacum]VCT90246.1 hypothetical protein MHAS_01950 [Mycolicibacterium hassiacum DSM 44199]
MWQWFLHDWSSVGLGAGIVLGLLLFCTDVCRSDPGLSRWRDPVWMSWMFAFAYLIHNFEEYGIDAVGRRFAFPGSMCELFGYGTPAECPIGLEFFAAVNVPLFWVALPVAAAGSRCHPAVGMTGLGIVFTNAMTHIGAAIIHRGYNPGLLTAVVVFLPLAAWAAHAFFGSGRLLRLPVLAVVVAGSALLHCLLICLVLAQTRDLVGAVPASVLQAVLGPVLLLAVPWVAERRWPANADPR